MLGNLLIAFVFTLAPVLLSSAAADDFSLQKNCRFYGQWKSCENINFDRQTPSIIVFTKEGNTLTIDVHQEGVLSMALTTNKRNPTEYNNKISLTHENIEIFVDNEELYSLRLTSYLNSPKIDFYGLMMPEELIEDCKKGRTLYMNFKDRQFKFPLSGFSKALARAVDISKKYADDD